MPIFMKIDGIDGSATGQYKGWIELDSAQYGVNRHATSATGQGANRESATPAVGEIVVTKELNESSHALFKLSLWGEHKNATIDFVGEATNGKYAAPYVSIELENTFISNYSISGTGADAKRKQIEVLALNFTKITYSSTPTSASTDPKVAKDRALWDLATGSSK